MLMACESLIASVPVMWDLLRLPMYSLARVRAASTFCMSALK